MKKFISYAAMAVALCACSNNDVTTPEIIDPQSATLSISTSVSNSIALTRTTGTVLGGNGTTTGPVMGAVLATGSQIGVCVYNSTNNNETYVPYTGTAQSENILWTASESTDPVKQIWVDSENNRFGFGSTPGHVFAYFPYNSELTADKGFDYKAIPVTPGYTDYLYGKSEESNVIIAHDSKNSAATIKLNHALAMVTFTFANTGYTGPSELQSITLNNLPNSGTLDITTGVTTIQEPALPNSLQIKKYTGAGYIEPSHADWATTFANNKGTEQSPALGSLSANNGIIATAGMFHAMVLPQAANSVNDHNATIVIDGVSHNISLAVQNSDKNWTKGKNYTYNLKLNGKNQLTVSSVTVNQWTEGGSSDIEI